MAVLIEGPRVEARRFFWPKEKKGEADGIAELSDLGNVRFGRVYGAVAGVAGLIIVGKGEEIPFVVVKVDWQDGETAGWWLASIDRRTGRTDGRYKILIVND